MSTMPGPGTAEAEASANAAAQASMRAGTPAINALRRAVQLALSGVFTPFFKQLPVALRRRAAASTVIAEQRNCTALAQAVASNPSRWIQELLLRVDTSLTGSAEAVKQASRRTVAGDDLLLTAPQLRAETQFTMLIGEFETQLELIRSTALYPIHAAALAPSGLCRVLRDTAASLSYGSAHLRVLFDQFDSLVLPQLPRLYDDLLHTLTEIAARATEAEAMLAHEQARAETLKQRAEEPAPPQPSAPTAPAPKALAPAPEPEPKPDTSRHPPAQDAPTRRADAPAIDEKTASMLRDVRVRAGDQGGAYGDGSLASDLLALQTSDPLPSGKDLPVERRKAPLQRIALAGQFLNEAIEDPYVPEELGPQHESVRFPLVKSALTDATLFTAVTHPLRSLVNELMLKSATSRITGTAEARHMAAVLQQVLVQFDLAPDFVREAMLNAEPISDKQINTFFSSQRQQAERRREAVVHEAKRLVVRELELRTFGRPIPQQAIRFLNTSWGPLLVKRLLEHGADHRHWREGLDLLEQLLDQLDDPHAEATTSAWRELMIKMSSALAEAKLGAERVKEAMSLLEAARKVPRSRSSL
jgi:hypothetical protein